MTASWDRALELFERAADLPAGDRAAWLEEHCPDPELRAEVEAMLRGDAASVAVLDRPPDLPEPPGRDPAEAGLRIGRYRLTEPLGEGGMGTVWAADQEGPLRRSVAIKLVKPGMDTRRVLARFAAERRLLARMRHPGIAAVHDAGETPDGRPYLVMQRVDGEPITTWCRRRDLGVRDRLELFLPVCEAVQHAHHKGVIHRDVKPSNVLVDEENGVPRPTVIDFGVAKLVEPGPEDPTRTLAGGMIGTPSYMSPEQVAGGDVDTRSDVYSLGALLYELLAGVPPFDLGEASPLEAERRIREETPPTPSTRVRATATAAIGIPARGDPLAAELDWIVMKALEKEPERRYPTPLELAADLRRYLASEPVHAGPPSRLYRARTFVRRHRLAVALAATTVVSLAAGLVGTTWMALDARRARVSAEQEARSARAVSGFLAEILAAADPLAARDDVPGREVRVADLLLPALERLDTDRGEDPLVRARLRAVLGRTLLGLGLVDEAGGALPVVLQEHRELLGREHPETLTVAHDLVRLQLLRGEYAEARVLLEETVEAQRRVLGPDHPDTVSSRSQEGQIRVAEGDLGTAETIFREVLASCSARLGEEDPRTVTALNNLGFVLANQGRREEAEDLYRRTLEINRRTLGEAHPYTFQALQNLGSVVLGDGRLAEADELFSEALRLALPVLGERSPKTLNLRSNLAVLRHRQERFPEALEQYREVLAGYRELFGPEHPHTLRNQNNLARALADAGDPEAALELYRSLLPTTDRVLPTGHAYRSMFRAGHGKVLAAAGRAEQARVELRAALPGLEAALGAEHPSTISAAALLEELGDP